jgi:two-component system, chemotaxis family, CheB/CheR fusion protein
VRGDVDPYLRFVPGEANLNLFQLIRQREVLAQLRPAMRRSQQECSVVSMRDLVVSDANLRTVSFEIVPYDAADEPRQYWVLFGSAPAEPASEGPAAESPNADEATSLRDALAAAVEEREQLAHEAAAAAEASRSTDEELRSSNEELETAKEELQSANEELLTLNGELLSRNTTLTQMNDDLENVLSTIEIPVVLVGLNCEIRRFNASAASLFLLSADSCGRRLSEARGVKCCGIEVDRVVADAIASNKPSDVETLDVDGRWRLLRVRPYRASDGTFDGASLAVVDIDKLKRSNDAAEKSAQLSSLLARAGSLLARSLDYEPALESLTGLAVPEFADWCSVDLLSEDGSIRHLAVAHANPFMRDLAEKFQQLSWKGGNDFRDAVLVSEVSASELTGGVSDSPYAQLVGALGLKSLIRAPLAARNRTFGTMTFAISDRTYGEDDLAFANELARHAATAIDKALLYREAEAANHYLHALLGTVAHEIRTPLTSILGWAQVAAETQNRTSSRQACEQIFQSASLIKVFVDDLLDTERIKMRKLRIEKEEVDLKAITETAVEMMRPTAESKRLNLEVETGKGPTAFEGDRARLIQVIWNLLSNAIKFTPEGGEIRVELTAKAAQARLTVHDTGIGIDRAALPRVFDLFQQASSGGARSAGLGVGLSIVKEVVTLHGGTVEAESAGAGKGSTITVLLPLEQRRRRTRRTSTRRRRAEG